MIDTLKRNYQLAAILFTWLLVGVYIDVKPYPTTVLIPLTVLLLKAKNRYKEIFFGFLFMLAMSDSWSHSMFWTKDARNIYMLLLGVFYFFDRKHFGYPNKVFLLFVPFLIWTCITNFRNDDMANAFQKTMSYSLMLIIIPAYFQKLIVEEGAIFLRDLDFFVAWLLLAGFILIPFNYDLVYLVERYRGVLGNPNGIGTFCFVFTTFFYILNQKFPHLFSKQEKIWVYALVIISLLMCESRNGLMSILLFLFFVRFYKISAITGFAVFVITLVGFQLISQNITEIIKVLGLSDVLRADSIESGSGRLVAWHFAWIEIQKNFFVGLGFDFDSQYFVKNAKMLSWLGHNGGIHNVFLGLWMCFGLIGVILFYQALLRLFIRLSSRSYLAIPLLYALLFSTSYEAWLMGSLNPFTVYLIMSLVLLDYDHQFEIPKKSLISV